MAPHKTQTVELSGDGRVVVVRKDSEQEKFWLAKGYKPAGESESKPSEKPAEKPASAEKEAVDDKVSVSGPADAESAQGDVQPEAVEKPKPKRGRRKKVEVNSDVKLNAE